MLPRAVIFCVVLVFVFITVGSAWAYHGPGGAEVPLRVPPPGPKFASGPPPPPVGFQMAPPRPMIHAPGPPLCLPACEPPRPGFRPLAALYGLVSLPFRFLGSLCARGESSEPAGCHPQAFAPMGPPVPPMGPPPVAKCRAQALPPHQPRPIWQ